jgi:multiple sugar transport system permease protein
LGGSTRLQIYVAAAAVLVLVWTLFPFLWMVWASFMTTPELLVGGIVQSIDAPTLENYRRIFGIAETDALMGGQTKHISRGFLNSLIVALPTALLATAIATIAGYAFGRFTFPAKRSLLFTLLITRVLPPIAILIPYFAFFQSIGLIGNHLGLIWPGSRRCSRGF